MSSPVEPQDLTPQPGAVYSKEGFIANGLPATDVKHQDWPDLPGSQAPNFVSVEPWELSIPSVSSPELSRVWGDPAWDIGRYWSEVHPQTANQFYGDFAVEYQWNGGLYLAALKALPAGVTSIKLWKGPTARQPAMLLDPSGSGRVIGTLMNWLLPGGGIQYYVPDGTFPYFANQKTAWNPHLSQATAIPPTLIAPLTAQQLPAGVEPATYGKLLEALGRLATLLRQIEASAGNQSSLLGGKEGSLSRSAELLVQAGEQLNQHLSSAATNADAKAQATLTLWSLVATGRHVDGDFSFSGQQVAVDQAITDVVTAAYALAQGTTHQEV
jgi:hypothetical protein